jgi:O-succinylbenzoate synthase
LEDGFSLTVSLRDRKGGGGALDNFSLEERRLETSEAPDGVLSRFGRERLADCPNVAGEAFSLSAAEAPFFAFLLKNIILCRAVREFGESDRRALALGKRPGEKIVPSKVQIYEASCKL